MHSPASLSLKALHYKWLRDKRHTRKTYMVEEADLTTSPCFPPNVLFLVVHCL